jgi:hypothetical protein
MFHARLRTRLSVLAIIAIAMTVTVVSPAGAAKEQPVEEKDVVHCVVYIVDQADGGELITTAPDCYETEAEAATARSSVPAHQQLSSGGGVAYSSTWTIGIHYNGFNGTGSSISVVGSSCTGGWWNTPSSWDNKISSSYNGCHRLKHHDRPNRGGSYQSTWGVGTTDNLSYMNNRTESVSYWSQ